MRVRFAALNKARVDLGMGSHALVWLIAKMIYFCDGVFNVLCSAVSPWGYQRFGATTPDFGRAYGHPVLLALTQEGYEGWVRPQGHAFVDIVCCRNFTSARYTFCHRTPGLADRTLPDARIT